MEKEFVLLTKSKKFNAYCVAGIDMESNQWIRIVTPHGGAIQRSDTFYENGEEADFLDIIAVECMDSDDIAFQPENYIMNPKAKWQRRGKQSNHLLRQKALDDEKIRDQVFYDTAYKISSDVLDNYEDDQLYSLMMIKVHNPYLILDKVENDESPKGVLSFRYKDDWYSYFRITDMDFLGERNNEDYKATMMGDYYIVVSLGEKSPYDKHHYKLIAKIFSCY